MLIPNVMSVSQLTSGALSHHSDCGPACTMGVLYKMKGVAMRVDDFYKYVSVYDDSGTSIKNLMDFLDKFGVETVSFWDAGVDVARRYVDQQRLAIWLINYKPWVAAGATQFPGTFNHWVVVVGYTDGYILCNDPYRSDGKSYIPVPVAAFAESSWKTGLVTSEPVPQGGSVADTTHRVKEGIGGLNVRTGPAVTYPTVGALGVAEEVIVTTIANDWAKVEGPRLFGYSYEPYLEKIPGVVTGEVIVYYRIEKPEGVTVKLVQTDE